MKQNTKTFKPSLKKEKTHRLLLDTAAQMFSRHGYQSTSLRDIAAAADMKAGSMYYHFDSKEALMIEVLDKSMRLISDTVWLKVEALGDDYSFEEGLEAHVLGHLTAILKYSEYTTTTIRNNGQVPATVTTAVQQNREHYEQQWRDLMMQGREEGAIRKDLDIRLFRLMVLGSLNWSSVWYKDRGESINKLAKQFVDVFLHGCG